MAVQTNPVGKFLGKEGELQVCERERESKSEPFKWKKIMKLSDHFPCK